MTAIPFGAKAAALAGDHGVLQAGAFKAVGQALLLTATSDGATSGVAVGCRSLAVNGKPRQVPVFTGTAAVTIATRTTDGAFTIRYAGHLEVPRDGVYMFEAATGEDASPLVDILKRDGMVERSRQFLLWLDAEHPEGRWAQFLTDDRRDLRWEQVTMAGISHGATTAARFAVHRPVDRVVMLSGPRDNTETWQGMPSATAANRFFGFTHVLDAGWTADHYCRSWQLLRMHEHGPVVDVEEAAPPYGNTRRLVTAAVSRVPRRKSRSVRAPLSANGPPSASGSLATSSWALLLVTPLFIGQEPCQQG